MRNAFIILSVLVLSLTLFGEEKKYKVAVMEFDDQTKKLSKSVLEAAAEYLRGELVASNQFIVISKDRQKAIVKEQKKESWKECYDQSCRIQLGQALSADTILTGSISKFGNSYNLTLELVDLAKEATVKGTKAEFNGTENGLKDAITGCAAQLTGVSSTSVSTNSRDQSACAFAKEKDDADVWQDYLKEYPRGICAFEAKTRIKEIMKNANKPPQEYKKVAQYRLYDDVVVDEKTNLMWQRTTGGSMAYQTAVNYCEKLELDTHNDWRLPSISELKTLIVGCQSGTDACKISDDCLSDNCSSEFCHCSKRGGPGEDGSYWQKGVWLGGGDWFWSSSTPGNQALFVLGVDVIYGGIYDNDSRDYTSNARCVRRME